MECQWVVLNIRHGIDELGPPFSSCTRYGYVARMFVVPLFTLIPAASYCHLGYFVMGSC